MVISDEDPKIITDHIKIIIFENLLNNQIDQEINNTDGTWEKTEDQIYTTIELEEREPSLENIKSIVDTLKNIKAPGEDNEIFL